MISLGCFQERGFFMRDSNFIAKPSVRNPVYCFLDNFGNYFNNKMLLDDKIKRFIDQNKKL